MGSAAHRSLLIVESPAKARTIRKYLGPSWTVKASLGHVKDLPKSKLGVDPAARFAAEYRVIPGKKKILADLVRSARQADKVYLGLDPDREGEAIAWHIAEELGLDSGRVRRVLFNEITRKGVEEGLGRPQDLDARLYEAQQARRILDRLVGYEISPVLWKKVRRGLSAGRVQSVALRLVVDRERDIESFVPREYWKICAELEGRTPPRFVARFVGTDGEKVEAATAAEAERVKTDLEGSTFVVASVERKERRRAPPPPFITSRLQQEAARRFRFTAKRTMMVAQQLYEGVDIGTEGAVGLITYMRTDSVRVAADAVEEARRFIAERFGRDALPEKPNVYKSRKGAQDAHEAIRPTSVLRMPEAVGRHLSFDQRRLYALIWERFVASQMRPAVYDQTSVLVRAGRHDLRASGATLRIPGWLDVAGGREPPTNGAAAETDDEDVVLPPLEAGDELRLAGAGVTAEQKFTQPPPRFTEGTLVRELEERGIGRPSTYASILSTIQDRKYVLKDEGRFLPTELGRLVVDRLVTHFPRILDVDFTASMEEALDRVEEGREDWIGLLEAFYGPFRKDVERAIVEMADVRGLAERTDEMCGLCGKPMVIKWGRNGRFLACSGYPDCRNTRDLEGRGTPRAVAPEGAVCEKCGKRMVVRKGRYGEFLACEGYPACKSSRPLPTGIKCPRPGCDGELVERRTKRGRTFYGCSAYNTSRCDFVVWGRPVAEPCPSCNASFLVKTVRRGKGAELRCATEGCSYRREEPRE